MKTLNNPFVIGRYAGSKYFCDREEETKRLISLVTNGNNVVLTGPRRIGKTDLLCHVFSQQEIKNEFIVINVDIYPTQSLSDFIDSLGRSIIEALRSRGKAVVDGFVNFLASLRAELTFDQQGMPQWGIGLGRSANYETTLDEIFRYIETAPRRCLIAIDEFQQITNYPNPTKVEALLRSYIQRCSNAQFIFSGSERHLMAEMFTSPARPFFQSCRLMGLPLIEKEVYKDFCKRLFQEGGKTLENGVVDKVYDIFDGITAYMQQVMNQLYAVTPKHQTCVPADVETSIERIVSTGSDAYEALYYQIPQRQRDVLLALVKDNPAAGVTSGEFVRRNRLPSPSSVATSVRLLSEKDILARDGNRYYVYDRFFALWLRKNILKSPIFNDTASSPRNPSRLTDADTLRE